MIKVVIFDLGGVCFDVGWLKINDEMLKRFGINILIKSSNNYEQLSKYYNWSLEGKKDVVDFFSKLSKKEDVSKIIEFYKMLYKKYKKPNRKIITLIRRLRKKFTVIGLTDTNKIHFEVHAEDGTLDNFDEVFTSFKLGSRKSDKTTFYKVLRKINAKPEEVVFIDDNDKNIEAAKSAGILTIKYNNYAQLIANLKRLAIL